MEWKDISWPHIWLAVLLEKTRQDIMALGNLGPPFFSKGGVTLGPPLKKLRHERKVGLLI